MPTYTYACPTCGHSDEVMHGMRETPELLCPHCPEPTRMERQITGEGLFLVKGGTVPGELARAKEQKEAREVAAAKDLVQEMSVRLRPTMKAAAEGRLPLRSKDTPAPPTSPPATPAATPAPNPPANKAKG